MKLMRLGILLGAVALVVSGCITHQYYAPMATDKNLYVIDYETIMNFRMPSKVAICNLDGSNCKPAQKN